MGRIFLGFGKISRKYSPGWRYNATLPVKLLQKSISTKSNFVCKLFHQIYFKYLNIEVATLPAMH